MHARVVALAVACVLCAAGSACASGTTAAAGAAPAERPLTALTPGSSPSSVPAAPVSAAPAGPAVAGVPWPATGPLFDGPPDDLDQHFCTASVLDSPGGDVVITAAHCVATGDGTPPRTGMSFVPGYHDGTAPFGVWTVTTAAVDPAWRASGDPAHDVAFLTVTDDAGVRVETRTGGYQLVADPGSSNQVDAIGYPDFADAPQVRSGTTTRFSPTQLELDAHGLYNGTSGGPWLRNGNQVVAVTGGFEQGGDNPEVSYASYFDDSVEELFDDVTR